MHIFHVFSLSLSLAVLEEIFPAIIGLSMTFNRESQKVLIKCYMCMQTKGINASMVVMEGFIFPLHIHRNFIHECSLRHAYTFSFMST